MRSMTLNKIAGFFDRHLFLSSFLLLVILGTLLSFYITYARTAHFYSMNGGIDRLLFSAKVSILGVWICVPLVFPISVFLNYFLKKNFSCPLQFSFLRRFILATVPALSIFFLITFSNAHEAPRHYPKEDMYLYLTAVLVSIVYSVMFGGFFGWQSKATKKGIILQSIAVNLLMVFYYALIYLLSHFSI